ncbi:MAG: class I SAM-dependent methyltransferase, partial [Actinomycetota bacterium]
MSSADFWDANATGRSRWAHKFDESFAPISARLVEMAGVSEGHRVLDIGTGTGEPALTAARLTGPAGRVVATDFSAKMLKRAAERAEENGLEVEFRVMDAADLDFPEADFDAALCQLVLMFLPDPGSTLRA